MKEKSSRLLDVGVDVTLKENINPANFTKLLLDLAKHLLLLKNQIPLQFEAIVKEVELEDQTVATSDGLEGSEDAGSESPVRPSRQDARLRQQKVRERRTKAKLLKNGRKLLEEFSSLAESVKSELEADGLEDVVSLSFLFGATAHSAREVYTLEVPNYARGGGGGGGGGHGLQLFRAMLGHADLGSVTERRLPVCRMFTVISRRSLPLLSSSSRHQPVFSLPGPGRCPRVNFTFTLPEVTAAPTTIRRLRFTSGAESEPCLIQAPELQWRTPAVSRQVVSMELCSPASCRMELATPVLPVTSQSVVAASPDSMELCTPLAPLAPLAGLRRRQDLDLTSLSLVSPDKRSRRVSSPTPSPARRETEAEQLHWFILETSIRGFKI